MPTPTGFSSKRPKAKRPKPARSIRTGVTKPRWAKSYWARACWAGAALLLLAGCASDDMRGTSFTDVRLRPASYGDLKGWQADDMTGALAAFRASCNAWADQAPAQQIGEIAGHGFTAGDMAAPCSAAAQTAANETAARGFFESHFTPMKVSAAGLREGLLTGYFEPLLQGSRTRSEIYRTPLLARPADLVMVSLAAFRPSLKNERLAGRVIDGRLVPYEDRSAIENGALDGRARPIVWVDDPVDAFFLQIQGSGRVQLEDGAVIRVGYAAQNGHPYTAIGRELIARGALTREEVTLPAIRDWLAANPDHAAEVMAVNASYVFFEERMVADPSLGPLGSQGVPLTPGRSLAVDTLFFPLGLPIWVDGEAPAANNPETDVPFRRLMIAQDTGGAIRGAIRGDVFWGFGDVAARRAGHMKHPGSFTVLAPKNWLASRTDLETR